MARPVDPASDLALHLYKRLHLRGPLAQQLLRGRRLLPRAVRRDIARVAEAQQAAGHPGIARQIDAEAVAEAHDRALAWLDGPEPKRRRALHLLGILASFVVSLSIGLAALALMVALNA